MRKPPRGLVLTVTVPFMAACMATVPHPLPEPEMRPSTAIRGVVLGDPSMGQRIEYRTLEQVEWTDSTVMLTGVPPGAAGGSAGGVTTRTYRIADLGAVLVREVDPNRTSLLVAGLFVGAAAIGAFLFTGKTDENTVF